MIRIGLHSDDRTLHALLASALAKEFQVLLEPSEEGIKQMLASAACDVVVLDLDGKPELLRQRIESSRRIIAMGDSSVIVALADDGLRSTAAELVRLGAYGYCRKPPSIRDLKAMLRRAYENSSLKRNLQTAQQKLDAASSCDRMIGSSARMQRGLRARAPRRQYQRLRAHHRRERHRQGTHRPRHPQPRRSAPAIPSWPSPAAPSPKP